jgi:ATP-dependent Clp protease ATP-binding subunit ClpA
MYERFTDRARKVMQLANQEAQRFHHEYIGTEHILLGLVKECSGVAANVLKNLDIDLRKIRLEVEKIVQAGPDMVTMGKLPQTPRAKKVIEYAIEESRNLDQNYVGTEHLLLGLLREEEGVGAQVLMNLGLFLEDVRSELLNYLGFGPVSRRRSGRPPEPAQLDWPAEVRQAAAELDAQIEQFNRQKESAVAEQNFELAAYIRDQADRLKKQMKDLLPQWLERHPVDPAWLAWNGGTVIGLARAINAERRWEDLPVLADALEEAGCTDGEILAHCRQPAEHSRHCWVMDLLLWTWPSRF